MFEKYGSIVKEEAMWNFPVISVSCAQDIEKIIKAPTKYPLRPPNVVCAFYRNSHPDKYKTLGIVNE